MIYIYIYINCQQTSGYSKFQKYLPNQEGELPWGFPYLRIKQRTWRRLGCTHPRSAYWYFPCFLRLPGQISVLESLACKEAFSSRKSEFQDCWKPTKACKPWNLPLKKRWRSGRIHLHCLRFMEHSHGPSGQVMLQPRPTKSIVIHAARSNDWRSSTLDPHFWSSSRQTLRNATKISYDIIPVVPPSQ